MIRGESGTGSSRPLYSVEQTDRVCNPFGDPAQSRVFVIGHDPRLRSSEAQAESVFFLDYLARGKPSKRSEAAKYELASATVDYTNCLTGGQVPSVQMYFTNLCNEFLPHAPPHSTVLIPNEVADRGIMAIERALAEGSPQVIIPMSLQVFYHLARSGFITGMPTEAQRFLQAAAPDPKRAQEGAYVAVKLRAFLQVCGKVFFQRQVPVVPVLHVKQWPLKSRMRAYEPAMRAAVARIGECLSGRHILTSDESEE